MGDLSEVHGEDPGELGFFVPRILADELRERRETLNRVLTAMLLNGWGTEQALMECYA